VVDGFDWWYTFRDSRNAPQEGTQMSSDEAGQADSTGTLTVISNSNGIFVVRGLDREPVTFSVIAAKLLEALLVAAFGKLMSAIFGGSGAGEDISKVLQRLISELSTLITEAITEALRAYQMTNAENQLLEIGDLLRDYQSTKHLGTLEQAYLETRAPVRGFGSLPAIMGYGGYAVAATIQLACATEMLKLKSKKVNKESVLRVIDEHLAFTNAQDSAIRKVIAATMVGAHCNGELMSQYPATNEGDPNSPEKRDSKTFRLWSSPSSTFTMHKIWLQTPDEYRGLKVQHEVYNVVSHPLNNFAKY
jgi:hypothetical protein